MQPYYQDADATLYHGDYRDVLPRLEPDSSDLVIADPPYGQRWQSRQRRTLFEPIAGDDGTFDVYGMLRECSRILRRFRHLYVFGLDTFGPLAADALLTNETELIWDKGQMGSGDLALPWGPQHERILFGVCSRERAQAVKGRGGLSARLRRGSVLRCDRPNALQVNRHPTEKPVLLLRQLIESSSCLGDAVLDPCAGVGSTLVAAKLEGRTSVGVELEERYCEVAADRLRQQALPFAPHTHRHQHFSPNEYAAKHAMPGGDYDHCHEHGHPHHDWHALGDADGHPTGL